MTLEKLPRPWEMDSRSHRFPEILKTTPCYEILSFLKEYDETCLEARAQMIKKINELLDKELSKK
jgi:hypothetical protein